MNPIDIIVYLAIIAIAFAMMYIPKKAEQKAIKKMQDELKQGDKVISYSGLSGIIEKIEEDRVTILLNPDKIKITLEKWAIAGKEE